MLRRRHAGVGEARRVSADKSLRSKQLILISPSEINQRRKLKAKPINKNRLFEGREIGSTYKAYLIFLFLLGLLKFELQK